MTPKTPAKLVLTLTQQEAGALARALDETRVAWRQQTRLPGFPTKPTRSLAGIARKLKKASRLVGGCANDAKAPSA